MSEEQDLEALMKRDAELQAEFDKVYAAREAKARQEARLARFMAVCDPEYQESDPAKIPNQNALRKVLAWKPGPRGLFLTGPTRHGKTRSVWMLLRRIMLTTDLRVRAYNGVKWSVAVSNAFRETDQTEGFLERIVSTDILLLDDLAKMGFTETQVRAIYGVIEERMANRKPTLITCNSTGKDLLNRLPPTWRGEDGESLLARVRESSENIQF